MHELTHIPHDLSLDALTIKQTLTHVTLKSFNGDPIDWKRFWQELQVMVVDRIHDPKQRLALLLSPAEGNAYVCPQSFYAHESRDEAYTAALTAALAKLTERFGDRELIVQLV